MADATALQEKVYAAEKNVGGVRLAVISLNSLVYLFLLDRSGTIPWLAYTIITVAMTYGALVQVAEPYRRFPLLLTSYFTTATDMALIALWIVATGTYDSPFYVLWYVSIAAVAFRFAPRTTLFVAALYAATYVALVQILDAAAANGPTLLVRAAYILFVGIVGALLSREATSQIAVRARMQERMREATEAQTRLRSIIEAAPDGVLVLDADDRIVQANSRAEAMFGAPRTALVGQPVTELLPSGHEAPDGDAAGAFARRHDGRGFPADVRSAPIHGGASMQRAVFIRDLSQARGPEDDLRVLQSIALGASEAATVDEALAATIERVCTATDWALGEVWVPRADGSRLDLRGHWHRPEPRLAEFAKRSQDIAFGPNVGIPGQAWATGRRVWVPDVTAAVPALPRAQLAKDAGLRAGVGVPLLVEGRVAAVLTFYMHEAREADERMARLVTTVAAQLGTLLQRKAAQEELARVSHHHRLILESAGEGIVELDGTGHVTFANAAAARMLGRPKEDLVGSFLHDGLHKRADGNACDWASCPIHDSLANGNVHHAHDEAFERAGQGVFAADFVSAPIRDQGGQIGGAVVVFNDVTDRRRAQDDQRRAAQRLQELERLRQMDQFKTQFINTAAHELGTPLTPIRLQLHLLKKSIGPGAPDPQKHALEILDRNVERLVQLVSDILDGARVQAGRLNVQRKPTDFSRVVEEAVESFHEPARHAGVAIASHIEPALVVSGDANRLTQVLFNLLGNALKFTPAGGRIEVQARRDGARVRLSVADTGAGLTADQISRLFRPFSQVHDQTAAGRTGTGLGLYICRGIVELHDGQIRAESAGPGKGAQFLVEVPLHAGPVPEAPRPPRSGGHETEAFDRRVRELI